MCLQVCYGSSFHLYSKLIRWLDSRTVSEHEFEYNAGLIVHLVKLPWIEGSSRDVDLLTLLVSHLDGLFVSGIHLSGVVFLCPVSGSSSFSKITSSLKLLDRLCGRQCLSSVIVATTFWTMVDPALGATRERDLITKDEYWAQQHAHGSPVLRHSGTKYSALAIMDWLLLRRRTLKLRVQKETAEKGYAVLDTAAGHLIREFSPVQGKRVAV